MKKLLTTTCLFVVTTIAIVSFIAPFVSAQEAKQAEPCESLKLLPLSDTTITAAEFVPAGPFRAPGQAAAGAQAPAGARGQAGDGAAQQAGPILPAYCRVAAVLKPSSDSNIAIEVWLPAADWNGKFQAVGNGGWAGRISYGLMQLALREGYATASTDTGHKGGGDDASFALGHPEKVVDFAYRSVHEMTVKAKTIIMAFYNRGPRLSYWMGCSTGGRQGLMEAQRYPEDFDGIIAGAPANYHNHLTAWLLGAGVAALADQAHSLSPTKIALVNQSVLNACDVRDGVKDGFLMDPRTCHFDPSMLLCREGDADNCLTAPQLETVRKFYAPAKTKTGELIYPGLELGSELGWTMGPEPFGISLSGFRYAVHQDPKWDWRTFDMERDTALADRNEGFINAVDPNLQAFKARGGKVLMYHGWSDPLISPENSINYYSGVLAKMGPKQDSWLRLFMMPGMGHCGGGPGPNQSNVVGALERWRESGIAPDQIIASHVSNNRVDMTRPLCPYPQIAQYKGTGSTNDAANFVCKVP